MINKKRSGTGFERDIVNRLNKGSVKARRIIGSGAIGTASGEPRLTGDVVVSYPWFSKPLHIECKFGYGGEKSLTLKRDWFTKARREAKLARRVPAILVKFKGVHGGKDTRESAVIVCMNLDTWEGLMREVEYLYLDNLSRIDEDFKGRDKNG